MPTRRANKRRYTKAEIRERAIEFETTFLRLLEEEFGPTLSPEETERTLDRIVQEARAEQKHNRALLRSNKKEGSARVR